MEKLENIKGAIFDLDGTLLDSTGLWEDIDRRFLAKRGISLPSDYSDAVSGMEFSEAAEYTVKRFGLKDTSEELLREWSELAEYAYARELKLKPFVKEYLELLAENGVKMGVATSSSREACVSALINNRIIDCFEVVLTTDEAGAGKEKPDIYLKASERLGVKPEECAVFEDILPAILSAKSAGFVTVGVYDAASEKYCLEILKVTDIFIDDFSQLL